MNVHGDLVGRLAKLHSIVSKPELNGSYVVIQAYLPEKDRYSVKTLPPPNADTGAVNIAVKLDSLTMCYQEHFLEKYLRQREVQVISFEKEVRDQPDGTTLRLNLLKEQILNVVLNKAHRFMGVMSALSDNGVPDPVTKYIGNMHVAPTSEDAILVFEDIHFVGSNASSPDYVTCTRGHSITFRRCVFTNALVIVAGEDPITTMQLSYVYVKQKVMERFGTPNVVLENCVIDAGVLSKGSTGIFVGNNGTLTLLNCIIRNAGVGVITTAGSRLIMSHCTIENCMNGIGVGEKTKIIELHNCSVYKSPAFPWFGGYGISVDTAGPAAMMGCRVEGGQDVGIYLRGKSKHLSRVAMSDCHVAGCGIGVCMEQGEFEATMVSTVLQNNSKRGLCIYPTVVGTIITNKCTFVENGEYNILNTSPAKNLLIVDGVVEETMRVSYQPPDHLAARRCGQRAGICDINCLYCGKKEESGEKFKKCGKCEDVCYCSRECQKAHWKEHKKTCMPQGNTAATAVGNEIKRFQEGIGSMEELRDVLQKFQK